MVLRKDDPYWQQALSEVYRSPDELTAQDEREVRRGLRLRKLIRGNPKLKQVALTFDDGPHGAVTERLLDILKEQGVKATFFVIGFEAELHPEIVQRMVREGHLVANHTFSHVTLTKIPVNLISAEYQANNDLLFKLTGKRPRFCRPPGGDYDRSVIDAANSCDLTTVLWTDDPADYTQPGTAVIEKRTLKKLKNGAIILLHDGVEQTLQILPQILDFAQSKGYEFVTVDQMVRNLGRPL
jgi:peptidoglycan/xylan/chitin deacetylase (PgdA/CDA1 family)